MPFPSPEDLPDPGFKPRSPAFQADALLSELLGFPGVTINLHIRNDEGAMCRGGGGGLNSSKKKWAHDSNLILCLTSPVLTQSALL